MAVGKLGKCDITGIWRSIAVPDRCRLMIK
jgi:hypothetical protein